MTPSPKPRKKASAASADAGPEELQARYLGHGFAWANGWLIHDGERVAAMDYPAEAPGPFYVRDGTGVVFRAKDGVYGLDLDKKLERGMRVLGADPKTFRLINDLIAEDVRQVYCAGMVVEGVAPGSYAVLGRLFIRSQTKVLFGAQTIEAADAATFEFLPGAPDQYFARDRAHVYHRFRALEGIHAPSFELLAGGYLAADKNTFYCIETAGLDRTPKPIDTPRRSDTEALGHGVYRSGEALFVAQYEFKPVVLPSDGTKVVAADLKVMAPDLVHDGRTVFRLVRLNNALEPSALDPASLEILGPHYVADAKQVASRRNLKPIEADRKSFRLLEDGYARDAKRVFPLGSDDVSPDDFVLLGAGYARAPEAIYHFNDMHGRAFEIFDADVQTFRLFEPTGQVALDANRVYLRGDPIRGATPESLRLLLDNEGGKAGPIIATREGVYDTSEEPIKGADGESFEVLSEEPFCGRDRERVFAAVVRGDIKQLKADVRSFEVLGDSYTRDKKALMYEFKPLKGVKPDDCRVLGGGYALAGKTLLYKGRAIRSPAK